ncbi:MAG: response regulator transcription factor [Cyclobacteriaceae bacterium]|jgi:DNA-binding NarL/FixJ family response regulator|nr:response regulator transcription factor [Cyclobacteriaceae bacterium]
MINILIVDDHTLVRDGIKSLLSNIEDITVCGICSTGEDAIGLARTLSPDIILMDIIMKGMTGIEATRWIKEQDSKIKIILLSTEVKKEFVAAGIKSGIDGYIPKDVSQEILLQAIRTVQTGERYFTEAITKLIFEDFYEHEKSGKKRERKITEGLTKRESEILQLVAEGIGNKEIGERLFISVKTVETHKTHILDKLGLKNNTELIKYAIKNNIITID